MKNQKMYESEDKMISLIKDNYDLLQGLGRFGIHLGFGDKTVAEVCENEGVDTYTFLAVVNFTINGYRDSEHADRLSVSTLIHYLKSSHEYFLNFKLPQIRKDLIEALDEKDNLAHLIIRLYDEYAHSIQNHMKYEEKTVFPFHNNKLTAVLYNIYNCETWLAQHAEVEEQIFIPAIRRMEARMSQSDVSVKISNMINQNPNSSEALSEREKDVVISVVQGMTNKEIADHLCISINTVITHRRNIARKLQIHSSAGLTIYAIVNNLVDISAVNL